MLNNYLPNDDFGKSRFLNNYASVLASVAASVGIDGATVQQVANDAVNFDSVLNATAAFHAFGKTITSYKNFLRDGTIASSPVGLPQVPVLGRFVAEYRGDIFGRLSKQVQGIKAHPKYTEAMGNSLGIIGAERPTLQQASTQPVLTHTFKAGIPNIIWKKNGHQGVHIYIDRSDGKGYGTVPYTNTRPDFLDQYPLPAPGQAVLWKYKAIYIENDNEIGQVSNELSITVAGLL